MTRLRIFLFRLSALVRSRQMDREIDDEIASHLAEATEEFVQQGLSPEEARWAAQRRFGGERASLGKGPARHAPLSLRPDGSQSRRRSHDPCPRERTRADEQPEQKNAQPS